MRDRSSLVKKENEEIEEGRERTEILHQILHIDKTVNLSIFVLSDFVDIFMAADDNGYFLVKVIFFEEISTQEGVVSSTFDYSGLYCKLIDPVSR